MVAAVGFLQLLGGSIFFGTAGALYLLRGLGDGLAGFGGIVQDVRQGEIPFVTQVLHKLEQIASSPMQSFARGMISQEHWARTEESMQHIVEAVQRGQLPNAIELRDVQLFIELLIPDLMPRCARGVVPSTVNEWMNTDEQQKLRQLHAVITQWLGEGVDGRVQVPVVDVENILLRVDVGAAEPPGQRRGCIFDPRKLVSNVANSISQLCIQYPNPRSVLRRTEFEIENVDIHEDKVPLDKLLQMGRAFQTALEEHHIPLYVIGRLTEEQLQEVRDRVLREAGDFYSEGTLFNGFCQINDPIGTRTVQVLRTPQVLAEGEAPNPVYNDGDAFFDASEDLVQLIQAEREDIIYANRGAEYLYLELLQKSIAVLQEQKIIDHEPIFGNGLLALQSVRTKYRTFFQQPPEEFFIIDQAFGLIVDSPMLNGRQHRTIVNAKAIAQRWLTQGMPANLLLPTDGAGDFHAALRALVAVEIEHDQGGIFCKSYTVRVAGDQTQVIAYRQCVNRVLERNEGALQRPIRQILDRVRTLKDSLGDLINDLITAPRTILDTYTHPSVVAAIAIGILLLSALLSAIFSLGSLHCLTALSMAGGLSVGQCLWHRAAAHANADTATKVMFAMVAVILSGMDCVNDGLVTIQVKGSTWLNSKCNHIQVIHHPITI